MRKGKVTIYTVAETAGVSIGTVSRVMNGKDRVAPETRRRVEAAARQLDFRPNITARGLATSKTGRIMLLVSDLGNVYFAEMAKHVSRCAAAHGYRLILSDSDEAVDHESEYLRRLADGHVDGAIIAPLTSEANLQYYRDLQAIGFPLVLMDTRLDKVAASSVRVDNHKGGWLAVEYLANKGHRRIALVSGNIEYQTNRLRFQGFRDALAEFDIPIANELLVLNQDFMQQEQFCGIETLLSLADRPTAIFATSDLTAIACIRKIKSAGLRVPEDVAVVGFDDLLISSHLDVPLTTIRQPRSKIARKAIDLLLDQLNAPKDAAPAEDFRIDPRIVIRESA
jgi:LacI family transcriptional regulator